MPGVIAVNLVGEGVSTSTLKKSTSTPQFISSSSKENLSSMQTNKASSLVAADGASQLVGDKARRVIHMPKPHYPMASRRLKEQGLVMVKLCVNEQGIVGEVGVSKSSGFHGLDQSALTTLAQWRFAPITANSARLSSQCFQTPVQFTLEG